MASSTGKLAGPRLRPDRFCAAVGFPEPPDRGRRLRLFCEEYGLEDRSPLLDATEAFEREELAVMVEQGSAGVSPHQRFLVRGEDQYLRGDVDWLVANRPDLEVLVYPHLGLNSPRQPVFGVDPLVLYPANPTAYRVDLPEGTVWLVVATKWRQGSSIAFFKIQVQAVPIAPPATPTPASLSLAG